jgi:gluconolactonase
MPTSSTIDGRLLQTRREPSPVDVARPRVYDDRLRHVISPSARVLSLYSDASWAEGPVWWEQERMLVFSDVIGRRTLGWREDGSVVAIVDPSAFANGNAVDAEGRLVHAEHGRRAISRTDGNGTHVLADAYEGMPLNSPNDLVIDRTGAVWFTDPLYGISDPREGYPAEPSLDHQSVYRWQEGRPLERMIDLDAPNGIGFSPDESTLYVAESHPDGLPRIAACAWNGETLGAPSTFATVDAGIPDGFAIDSRGWLWISSEAGVVIVDETGARLGVVPTPHVVSNCAFDSGETRLFLTGNADVWMLPLT